ncbi:class I SAM-dependent methyltransferase [Pseudonocardia sp. KRD291]|uniref:class I SAM-dependent methyltransferase n=1 Tax=Pseudonocardia sp. KRD291 TaxID=2792007 RepID=UPI001C4A07D3|nr:class I SAM-dependent methyltransferase [Pseudonocardia sp. KRD291]MBW0102170.1 class I SAM-dependent methyltransferase [Pseudonocardia sp. KRD291]
MTTEKVDLRGAAATLLMTLYMHAFDARSRRPILGDPYAQDVLDRIDYDAAALRRTTGDTSAVVSRAKRLDEWTTEFLVAEPAGQVLHLGCGLDSRPLRVRPPRTCRWIDVDQPEVIELRRRLYDVPDHVESIPSSVTDEAWWDRVSTDRPTLVVAEGLLMYLTEEGVHALLGRALDRLPRGVLAFDAVAPWTVTASKWTPEFRAVGARFHSAWDRSVFESRYPALQRLDDVSVYDMAALAEPRLWLRPALFVAGALPPLRDSMRLHRYRFGR